MSQSVSINQKTREQIADKLTLQAVAEAAKRFKAKFKAQNQSFWTAHEQNVFELTGLDKSKLRELIQAGTVRSVTGVRPQVSVHDEDSDRVRWIHPLNKSIGNCEERLLRDLGLFDSDFGPICGRRYMNDETQIMFRGHSAIPRVDGMERLDADTYPTDELVELATDASRLIDSMRDFRAEAMKILDSCRSSRQLEDLWPEASKLIPKKTGVGKSVVPKDAVDRVRDKLAKGIPA